MNLNIILLWIAVYCVTTSYVKAQAPIRLVDGPDELSGRVEVFINSSWSTVCDDSWDINDANVVCRQLGHGTAKQADQSFGEGTGEIAFEGVECTGDELFLDNCTHQVNHDCVHGEDVGVVCNSNVVSVVRLVGGQSRYEGRVEVYYDGQWGSICDDGWGMQEAQVICRQLGFGLAFAATNEAYFGPGSGEIFLDDVGCSGDEEELGDCSHTGWGVHDCTHSEDAGVICNRTLGTEGEIRLVGGVTPYEGRVEIYHAGEWGTVCDDMFASPEADVVCAQLGFGTSTSVKEGGHYGQGSGKIWLDELKCVGTEAGLAECPSAGWRRHNCGHNEDVGVVCSIQSGVATVRLVDGQLESEGRVEIFNDGEWGTICDDSWDITDANVVCRQLGYHKAVAIKIGAYYGQGTGAILLDDVECVGDEEELHDCASKGWGVNDCGHSEDAGVVCGNYSDIEIEIRLVDKGEVSSIMGRLEVNYEGTWGTVCDDRFDLDDANVVCNQLGYPGADHFYSYGDGSTDPILLTNIECGGYETNLGECAHSDWYADNCVHTEDVGIVCNKQPSTAAQSLPLVIIIPIVVGATIGFLILLTIIIIICCYCYARKKTGTDITEDTGAIITPPDKQTVPLEDFYGRHSFMFVNTPNGVEMVTPSRPGSYVAGDTPPSTAIYSEGQGEFGWPPEPAVYKPPTTNGLSVPGYLSLTGSPPIREQNGSLPRDIADHNGNGIQTTPHRSTSYSQHELSYEQPAIQLHVPVQPSAPSHSNYVGDDETEYSYVNPLQVSDEAENNAMNKNKEVTEMLV